MPTPTKTSGRLKTQRTRDEILAEADRIGHELISRAKAVKTSPHPHLALEQLEAELEQAGHLAPDVKRIASESNHSHHA
jgi:hypothetical protein